ncbi:MAG: hypothetical protein ACYSTL_04720 [Planctomycetota bacterium]|jgi:hypothetical protein
MSEKTPDQLEEHSNPREPVNVIDGIPDRSPRAGRWKIVLIAAVFCAWVAFLVYCQIVGRFQP